MDEVLVLLMDGVATLVKILREDFVFTIGAFQVSYWDFMVAFVVLGAAVPLVLVIRSADNKPENKGGSSERIKRRKEP